MVSTIARSEPICEMAVGSAKQNINGEVEGVLAGETDGKE